MTLKKVLIFLIVGGITVGVDYLVYRSLDLFGFLGTSICKALGFIGGSIFGYVVNRLWTFSDMNYRAGSWLRFGALYALTLLVNIYINKSILVLTYDFHYSVQIAFLLATGVSAILNFFGMNYFVFSDELNREVI